MTYSDVKMPGMTTNSTDVSGNVGRTARDSQPTYSQKLQARNKAKNKQNTKSPFHSRKRLSEDYEKCVSGRESWWRATIKETPVPGAYESGTFIDEMRVRPNTYRFKTDGRKINPQPQIGKGESLMPGAYEYEDLAANIDRSRSTYAFRDTSRDHKDFLNFGVKDKDVNVSPNAYGVEKHLQINAEKTPSKHSMFKSGSQRFPTIHFKPKDGPAPGNYDYNPGPVTVNHTICSSFKSKTPRFPTSHTHVPGPGFYARTHKPTAETITRLGRDHGLFFSSSFMA